MHLLFGGGSAGPDTVAGLTGWWDAGNGVYSDAGTTPAVDGATVQQWNDRSVGGNNLTQATAGNRPTFKTGIVNGNSVVRFGGATDDDFMTGPVLSTLFGASAKTAFAVVKHANNASGAVIADSTNDFFFIQMTGTGTEFTNSNYDGSVDAATITGLSSGTWYIATYMHNGTSVFAGANDTRAASMVSAASGATTNLGGTFAVGRRTAGTPDYPDADIAEVVTYNAVLSEADRQIVERYLASKYGITLPY